MSNVTATSFVSEFVAPRIVEFNYSAQGKFMAAAMEVLGNVVHSKSFVKTTDESDEFIRRRCHMIAKSITYTSSEGKMEICDLYVMRTQTKLRGVVCGVAVYNVSNRTWMYDEEISDMEFEKLIRELEVEIACNYMRSVEDREMDMLEIKEWLGSQPFPAKITMH